MSNETPVEYVDYAEEQDVRNAVRAEQEAELAEEQSLDRLRATLATIAELIGGPCPPPDVANGYDMCPCGTGSSWPCSTTRAAWLARGLDPEQEISRTMRDVRNELIASSPEW